MTFTGFNMLEQDTRKKVFLNLRMEKSLFQNIQAFAWKNELRISEAIRELLRRALTK
jgi:AraC-like DNA-binding protein